MSSDRNTALKMISTPEDYSTTQIIDVLVKSDDLYNNIGEPFLEDSEYDTLRLIAQRMQPHNVYFTGVGAKVRGGKIKLPFEMGSLDQVEIGDIADWIGNWSLQNELLVLSDKMDGTSALIIYGADGNSQIAYSRGDGLEAADITRHIFKIKNVPTNVGSSLVVRAEVELTETAFADLKNAGVVSRSGKPYKNSRNMVAGLMNSKTNPDIVYDYLTVIAYEVIDGTEFRLTKGEVAMSKLSQFAHLSEVGFQTAEHTTVNGSELTDEFLADYLNNRRSVLDYEIDGIVVDVSNATKRAKMNPTKETLNPAYCIKYKVADASNYAETEVLEVEWNISKTGYIKPRIILKPVALPGITVKHATGYNARYIRKNKIGKGTIVAVSRMGDVVPNVIKVIRSTQADFPEMEYIWSVNDDGEEVDIFIPNINENDKVIIQQTVDFFASINAPYLKEGNVIKLNKAGLQYPENIITASKEQLVAVIGSNGVKIYNGLRKVLSGIEMWKLVGSTNFFGRGVGRRKFKKLLAGLNICTIEQLRNINVNQIISVHGFEEKTANKIVYGMADFIIFYVKIKKHVALVTATQAGDKLQSEKIAFTGFRDAELQKLVEQNGGDMQSSVSGKTTILVAKDPNSASGKMKKARDAGTKIMGIDEFKEMIK